MEHAKTDRFKNHCANIEMTLLQAFSNKTPRTLTNMHYFLVVNFVN